MVSGQVGLMLLVIMGLVVGLVMSIASRSLFDTVLTRQERENTAAFTLAESGVEQALSELSQGTSNSNWTTIEGTDLSGIYQANYAVDLLSSFEMSVHEGEGIEIDLATFPSASLTVDWTRNGSASENPACSGTGSEGSELTPAAMGVTIIGTGGVTRRAYYNPANCTISGNGFAASNASSQVEYRSSQIVSKQAGDQVMRLTPIYNNATIRVTGVGLTDAMFRVASVATGGDSQKEIEVKRSRDAAGSVFDFAVFSGGTIVHN